MFQGYGKRRSKREIPEPPKGRAGYRCRLLAQAPVLAMAMVEYDRNRKGHKIRILLESQLPKNIQ